MKYFKQENVYNEALKRINYIFDEFPNVVVSFSGGKDSTVVLNLTLKVAEERGRLPVKVMFLDQEAEWQMTIDYMRTVMNDPRVEPMWFQIPLKLFNASSTTDNWLYCWEEGKTWMREQEEISIKENRYGTDRFADLFTKITNIEFAGIKTAVLGGVRAEESPARTLGLTNAATYKHITYGKNLSKNGKEEHYTLYPIYDWSYTDIWKAIFDNKWKYCRLYDMMYTYGVTPMKMRVSNVHHETAIESLYILQEIEADTWSRLTERISGINTAGQMKQDFFKIRELPYMFKDWREYRDYLLENIITEPDAREAFRKRFASDDKIFTGEKIRDAYNMVCITAMLHNDYHMTKMDNFRSKPDVAGWRRWNETGEYHHSNKTNKYI